MKNSFLKKPLTRVLLIVILLPAVLLPVIRCNKKAEPVEKAPAQEIIVRIPNSKTAYNVQARDQLNELVRVLAKEKTDIEILEAGFGDVTTVKDGTFKAITARYRIGDEFTQMVVPLAHESDEALEFMASECEMKCTSAWGCTACKQTIEEKCKSQTCSCTSGNGGCSSKITFN